MFAERDYQLMKGVAGWQPKVYVSALSRFSHNARLYFSYTIVTHIWDNSQTLGCGWPLFGATTILYSSYITLHLRYSVLSFIALYISAALSSVSTLIF